MVKIEITADNFMIGMKKISKGSVIELAPPIARYIVKSGEGKIVGETVKKKAVKKATYKTRVMKAEK